MSHRRGIKFGALGHVFMAFVASQGHVVAISDLTRELPINEVHGGSSTPLVVRLLFVKSGVTHVRKLS